MLKIWVDADEESLKTTVYKVLGALDVPFTVLKFVEGDELPYVEPGDIIMAMGSGPVDRLKKTGLVHKGLSISSLRGKTYAQKIVVGDDHGYAHWMVSQTPGMIWIDAKQLPEIRWDLRLAYRFAKTGSLTPPLGKYGWVKNFDGVLAYIDQCFEETGKPVQVSTDLETMGLDPYTPGKEILTVSMTPVAGYADVLNTQNLTLEETKYAVAQIRQILNSEKVVVVGANLKFDLKWMRCKWGITCSNFRFDTLIVGSLINENRSNSLNNHAKEYTPLGGYDDPFNQKHDKAHMEKALAEAPDEFVTYAGGDTDACLQVAQEQFKELAQLPEVKRFYVKLLHPAARAFESIEHRGLVVDLNRYKELESELSIAQKEAEKTALGMIPARLKLKHEDKGVSLTRKALLEDFLFGPAGLGLKPLMTTEKSEAPSTAKAHLMMFADHPEAGPFIQAYNEWNSTQKTLSTYVHGFLKHLRPDGRFHPTYMLFAGSAYESKGDDDGGTNTGRLSCVDPAMQTVPKHTKWAKKLRKCFPAPPGMVFWEADFSQGELRITADVADEQQMLHAYSQGLDLHAVTGAQLAGYELDEFLALGTFPEGSPEEVLFAKYRQQAKPANFGLLYGMGAEGFREFARVTYKLNLTLDEATQIRDQFFVLYNGLPKWHTTYKNFAKANGFVMSPLGRMRNLPLIRSKNSQARSKAERQAVNAPIQGCLSDMNIWSSAILEQNWGGEGPDKLWVAGSTHDAVYGYCPEHNAKEVWLPRIVEVMSTLPLNEVFGWQPKIPMPADIAVGPSLGELAKFKLAA